MSRLLVSSFLFLPLFACVADSGTQHESSGPTVFVESLAVTLDTVSELVPVDGFVRARQQANVATRTMATVVSIDVDVGDRVRAGQIVIALNAEDVAADRVGAEAGLTAARAAYEEASKQSVRMDTLYASDVVPLVRRDEARLNATVAQSRMLAAEAALRQVQNAERYTILEAPFNGTVIGRHVQKGDLAVPGSPLLEIAATGSREAVLQVPSTLISRIGVGQTISVGAASSGSVAAPITAIAAGANSQTRTFEVLARLPETWPPGVSVAALIPGDQRTLVRIPITFVVRRGQLTGVRVATEDGSMLRWIRLGRTTSNGERTGKDWVEVLSGLEPGERVVR